MTICRDLTSNDQEESKKKPIKFVKFISEPTTSTVDTPVTDPSDWDYIDLIKREWHGYDVMHAWNKNKPGKGILYLGYWNDGVVE